MHQCLPWRSCSPLGFSFKSGEIRAPFDSALALIAEHARSVVSIDIPSGWDVEAGPPAPPTPVISPALLISLTAPKLCARAYTGAHYLAGRFVPQSLEQRHQLCLPTYPGTSQCIRLA